MMLTRFLARAARLESQREDDVASALCSGGYLYALHPSVRDPEFNAQMEQFFNYKAAGLLKERHLLPVAALFDTAFFDEGFPARAVGFVKFMEAELCGQLPDEEKALPLHQKALLALLYGLFPADQEAIASIGNFQGKLERFEQIFQAFEARGGRLRKADAAIPEFVFCDPVFKAKEKFISYVLQVILARTQQRPLFNIEQVKRYYAYEHRPIPEPKPALDVVVKRNPSAEEIARVQSRMKEQNKLCAVLEERKDEHPAPRKETLVQTVQNTQVDTDNPFDAPVTFAGAPVTFKSGRSSVRLEPQQLQNISLEKSSKQLTKSQLAFSASNTERMPADRSAADSQSLSTRKQQISDTGSRPQQSLRTAEDTAADGFLLNNSQLDERLSKQKLQNVSLLHQAISARHERIARMQKLQMALLRSFMGCQTLSHHVVMRVPNLCKYLALLDSSGKQYRRYVWWK